MKKELATQNLRSILACLCPYTSLPLSLYSSLFLPCLSLSVRESINFRLSMFPSFRICLFTRSFLSLCACLSPIRYCLFSF